MEDTLREVMRQTQSLQSLGLNPCFNGRYSQSFINKKNMEKLKSLNPCFNGRYSQSIARFGIIIKHSES